MIAWDEVGTGPPMVLVHGLTEDRRSWDPALGLLSEHFRCVRLDLPGHGASPGAADYGALAMATDLASVVAAAGIDEPPVVVGHSLGAVVATAYASQAPVRAVVNVDQPLRFGDFASAIQPFGDTLRGPDFHATLAAIFANLGVERLAPPDRAWADTCHSAAKQDVVLGVWEFVLDTPPTELTALAESMLPTITAPYLAIHGGDPGDDYLAWVTGLLPDVTVDVWDGDGHYPHMVEPRRFAEHVIAFVA